jgi:hypothetical protein
VDEELEPDEPWLEEDGPEPLSEDDELELPLECGNPALDPPPALLVAPASESWP